MAGGWFPRRGRGNTDRKKLNIRFFRLETLRIATNNFSTLLGRGGYGSVYKGVLPDDGTTVAIKKFREPYEGFLEMVEVMSHLRHINLIQVIGCCTDDGQQLLVCEFAHNGSVSERLHSEKKERAPAFDWEMREAVCLGTARGLSYLHHDISPGIIHRDIKPSNILLDANFVPKIVDFDLIQFDRECVHADGEERPELTHLYSTNTTLGGTYGYLDPNYVVWGQLTEKVDVFSFGIFMLEIITGRRPFDTLQENDDERMLSWVTRVVKGGMVLKIVDPKLTHFPKEDGERFINVALLCTQAAPEQRPTMFDVVHMLYGRHRSDQQISEMAIRVIADQTAESSTTTAAHSLVSRQSLITSIGIRDGSTSVGTVYAEETESREEAADKTTSGNSDGFTISNSQSRGECSSSAAVLAPLETTRLASSNREDVATTYFDRSMEKITRYHFEARINRNDINTIMTQTTVINKSSGSGNRFKEAVYPPFLSGEFHRRPSHF